MSLILNIDSSQETAFVCIAENGKPLCVKENYTQKDHAAFLHEAIKTLTEDTGKSLKELDAIAVTKGPGSYTGLRVGMSAAKGICYALELPLLTVITLEMMANDIIITDNHRNGLICPMIDARRLEVFTAVYNYDLKEIISPTAMILDSLSFSDRLNEQAICFLGSGANKFQQLIQHENVEFLQNINLPLSLSSLSHNKFQSKMFDDLALTEPLYIKEYKAF